MKEGGRLFCSFEDESIECVDGQRRGKDERKIRRETFIIGRSSPACRDVEVQGGRAGEGEQERYARGGLEVDLGLELVRS